MSTPSFTILADFDESLHPRDERGRFGESGGGDRPAWSPTMSRADAEKWSAGSALPGPLYHGTSEGASYYIEKFGFKPGEGENTGNYGYYGRGAYLTPDRGDADVYSRINESRGLNGAVLETVVNVQNPMPYRELMDVWKTQDYKDAMHADSTFAAGSKYLTDYARVKGYDAIVSEGAAGGQISEVVVLDPHNVVVVK